jgi:hypothetical protein
MDGAGKPKICDDWFVVFEEDVGRFEISMNDLFLLEIDASFYNFQKNL